MVDVHIVGGPRDGEVMLFPGRKPPGHIDFAVSPPPPIEYPMQASGPSIERVSRMVYWMTIPSRGGWQDRWVVFDPSVNERPLVGT